MGTPAVTTWAPTSDPNAGPRDLRTPVTRALVMQRTGTPEAPPSAGPTGAVVAAAVVKVNVSTLGFRFTKEFVRFNQTWRVSEVAEALGEAYNKLLNHLHLGPITTSSSFVTTGGGDCCTSR
jgi:hypothetical protein